MVNHALTSPPLRCRELAAGGPPPGQSCPWSAPPPLLPHRCPRPKAARRSCGCTSCWRTSSRANRRSICRSASRNTRSRRLSALSWRRISTISAATRRTRARTVFAAPPPRGLAVATSCLVRSTRKSETIVLNGTREGLFLGAIAAERYVGKRAGKSAILIPNPFYAAYSAGASAANCEPVYLPTTAATGFLPDLDAIGEELLARTAVFYLASPSNPQGAVADVAYLTRLAALAQRFGFLVFADECYCEIYLNGRPPNGMLEVSGSDFNNVVVFHSSVETLQPARPACRLCRRRPPLPRPLCRAAQHRGAAGAGADAGGRHSGLCR